MREEVKRLTIEPAAKSLLALLVMLPGARRGVSPDP